MAEFLKSWAINVVTVAIFVTFLEILLPSSSMKRYIRMIIGLLIIYVIINPFINLINKDINIEREVFANIDKMNSIKYETKGEIQDLQAKQIAEIYKAKIAREIKGLVESNSEYTVLRTSIDIIEDSNDEDFGLIRRMEIHVTKDSPQSDKGPDKIEVPNVKEVNITIKNESQEDKTITSKDSNKIQEIICNYYKIPKEDVHVYLGT